MMKHNLHTSNFTTPESNQPPDFLSAEGQSRYINMLDDLQGVMQTNRGRRRRRRSLTAAGLILVLGSMWGVWYSQHVGWPVGGEFELLTSESHPNESQSENPLPEPSNTEETAQAASDSPFITVHKNRPGDQRSAIQLVSRPLHLADSVIQDENRRFCMRIDDPEELVDVLAEIGVQAGLIESVGESSLSLPKGLAWNSDSMLGQAEEAHQNDTQPPPTRPISSRPESLP